MISSMGKTAFISILLQAVAHLATIAEGKNEGKCGEPDEKYKDCGGAIRYYFHFNQEVGRCLIWTSSCLDVPQTYTSLKECEDTCYDSTVPLPCRNPLPNRTCYPDQQGSDLLPPCPERYVCKFGVPDPACCPIQEEEWFGMAYSTSCPGGRAAAIIREGGIDYPFISHICYELECPAGFECVEINDLFVKCCANLDQQLALGQRVTTARVPGFGEGRTEGPGQLPPFPTAPVTTELVPTSPLRTEYCPGAYEVYLECGSFCPLSCENPKGLATCEPGCSRGCHCRGPFIRLNSRPDSPCVLPHQCPDPRCTKPGEVYTDCGSVCPENCAEPKRSCGDWCHPGCHCRSGLIRFQEYNEESACVHPSQCNDPVEEARLGAIPRLSPRSFFTTEICKPNSCPPNSRCIPVIEPCPTTNCPRFKCETAPSGLKEACPDPMMYWSECVKPCIAACFGTITGMTCSANVCKPSCVCKLPYVLLNAQNPFSPCVRQDLCPGKSENVSLPTMPTPSPTITPQIIQHGGKIVPVNPKPLVECFDEKEECPMWAEYGLCSTSSAWMLLHCQRSCDCCGCSPGDLINADNKNKCEDRQEMCAEWAKNDQCRQNFAYMEVYCRMSCNICQSSQIDFRS